MTDSPASGKIPRKLNLTPQESKQIIDHIQSNPADLLQIPTVRALLAKSRFERVEAAALETLDETSEAVRSHAIEHNMNNLRKMEAVERPSILVYPLRGIEYVVRNAAALKVLTIGPRTESEIFSLIAAGFDPEKITGLDLISYSDFVQLGDMHAMPFDDGSFDVVIMGWVLPYSSENQRVADEAVRVAKPGGIIAIGCPAEIHGEPGTEEAATAVGGVPVTSPDGSKTVSRFFNSGQLMRLFEGKIDTVYFRQDPHPATAEQRGNVTAVFRLNA